MNFDPEPFVQGIKAENEKEQGKIEARRVLALEEAHRLATSIKKQDPAVRNVFLFGSLAEGGPGHLDFDIDLALEGGDLYHAMDITEASSFSVDLVDLERLAEHIRARILAQGIRL